MTATETAVPLATEPFTTVRDLAVQLSVMDQNAPVLLILRDPAGVEQARAGWLDLVTPDRESGTVDLIARGGDR